MPKGFAMLILNAALLLLLPHPAQGEMQHRLGIGAHYWKALTDVDPDEFDQDGLGWLITYKLVPSSILNFQLDFEVLPKGYAGSDHRVVSPQGFVLAGDQIYGALGVGVHYSDGDFADKAFFILRAGFDMELLPSIYTDINVNYRFEEWDSGEVKPSVDTLTLGAAVRFRLSS